MRPSAISADRDKGMVRLYAWVMIATTGLTVIFALLATRTVPQYSASAEVLIDPTITPSGNYISPSMPTEQRVATSTDVVATAAARLGITPAQALGHLSVTVPVDTQVLVMKYTDDTPAEALSGATAIAQTYIKDRNPANGKNVVASLVGPPKLPSGPVTTNYPVVFGVAVLGGLLIGFGLAWTWDRLRGRVITISDAEQCSDLDALAVLPGSSLGTERRTSAGLFHLDSLAARVLGQVEDQPQPSVLVTGVGPRCGVTTVAAQTALAMARMGRVVILVTADVDVIAKLSPEVEPTYESPQLGLHIVPLREWDGGGAAAAELMSLLRELHDRLPEALLVIDGPPAWQSAGIALRADRVLLVVALGQSSRTSTSAAVQALDHCTEKLVGLVITSPRGRLRGALASTRTWVNQTVRRVVSRVAPPAPATSAPRAKSTGAPQVNGSAPTASGRKPRGATLILRGWNGLRGGDDAPSGVTSPERISVVGRISVPPPNGKSTRSSST